MEAIATTSAIGLGFANDAGRKAVVAPYGGSKPCLATNPLAVGIPRRRPPHLVIAIDVEYFMPRSDLADRVEQVVAHVKDGNPGVRVPGEAGVAAKAAAAGRVTVSATIWARLVALAAEHGIEMPPIEEEAWLTLENLMAVLSACGSEPEDVVRCGCRARADL